MISLQVFPWIGAVRTRGPYGKIRTAGARVIPIRFKDLGFRTAEMLQKEIKIFITPQNAPFREVILAPEDLQKDVYVCFQKVKNPRGLIRREIAGTAYWCLFMGLSRAWNWFNNCFCCFCFCHYYNHIVITKTFM